MAYQMAATAVTLNDLEGHSPVAGLFKCNPSNICAAFYTISTGSVLALSPECQSARMSTIEKVAYSFMAKCNNLRSWVLRG